MATSCRRLARTLYSMQPRRLPRLLPGGTAQAATMATGPASGGEVSDELLVRRVAAARAENRCVG
jgi:hypothetical protein